MTPMTAEALAEIIARRNREHAAMLKALRELVGLINESRHNYYPLATGAAEARAIIARIDKGE